MVDLALMAKLVRALPRRARLILLGDRDQLASVQAGAVLGDICAREAGVSGGFRARLERVTGERPATAQSPPAPLQDAIVGLRHSYRFSAAGGIGRLAERVKQGDGEGALALLCSGQHPDIRWQGLPARARESDLVGRMLERWEPYWTECARRAQPGAAFAAYRRFGVLCAYRSGPTGAESLNRALEHAWREQGRVQAGALWYPGRPVMVTQNDYVLGLFNGDVGITFVDEGNGQLHVLFESAEGGFRRLHPARLPAHESVYAMTVHKSQGSEFDEVLLLLPAEDSPVLSRELIYTGLSRARSRVEVWGAAGVFQAAVGRRLQRSSGLRDALWPRTARVVDQAG
jgi:exodeoxyribonuclease V alpha subunit